MSPVRARASAYMEWAKTYSRARFNLASSGVAEYPIARLPASLEDLDVGPPGMYGYAPLVARIAAHCGVETERVATATGASMANHLVLAALLDPGDEVLVEHPTYAPLVDVAGYLGAEVRRFPRRAEEDFRVDPEAVARALTPRTRLVVITNPHNPSGAVAGAEAIRGVGEHASGIGARVLVDEVYRDALFEAAPASAATLGEPFVVTSSLTKAYGLSALRCGWIVADPDLVGRLFRLDDLFGVVPAHPAERLAVAAFSDLPRIAARARTLLDANRALLRAFLEGHRDRLEAPGPGPAMLAFPRLRAGGVESFCVRARERYQVTLVPGRFFGMPDRFRLSVGGETAVVRDGLERLSLALRGADGSGREVG